MQMAQKYDIMYVNFYTDGSAARKVAPAFPVTQPKQRTQTRQKVKRIMMAVGLSQLDTARDQAQTMENYVNTLTQQNQALQDKYYGDLDLEQVEQTALALGMVYKDQIPVNP